jgi:hypothetical protein
LIHGVHVKQMQHSRSTDGALSAVPRLAATV